LDKLPGIGGTGQKKSHAQIRHVNSFIQAADRDDPVKESTGGIPEDFFPILGGFPECEIADL
jgi:hypothetical protein